MFRSGYKSLLVILFILAGSAPLAAYYYDPGNQPPGPPPNYNQIDPTLFYGVPSLGYISPDMAGDYFVYFDEAESLWTIKSVIPFGTDPYEQFHGAILVQLDEEPAPGVNIWPEGFELSDDLHRNDRWGWTKWPDSIAPNLYEIWWDITTECHSVVSACTQTIGYWKTHAGLGPQEDVLTPLLPIRLGQPRGRKSLNVTDARMAARILSMEDYGRASNGITELYAQLLAAKLNIAAGALGDDITDVIAKADEFLARNNFRDWGNLRRSRREMISSWMDTLDRYNNGLIGPGHCNDDTNDWDKCPPCVIGISFKGCAFDFNLWGSSYNRSFGAGDIYVGGQQTRLSSVADFSDTFEGIEDPYGHPFGCNPPANKLESSSNFNCLEPNLSIFTPVMMPGAAYNADGLITPGSDYGDIYSGSRVYEGNGIQFSVDDCRENNPPTFNPPVGLLKPMTICLGATIYDTIIANDFDAGDTVTITKISGPGDFVSEPGLSPVYGYFTWTPTQAGFFAVVFKATDNHGESVIDSVRYAVTFNEPPVATANDTTIFACWEADRVCYAVDASDFENDSLTFALLSGPGEIDPTTGELCFTPGGPGQFPFVVEVSDICGADTVDFTITVKLNNSPKVLPYDTIITLCEIDTICFNVRAIDLDPYDSLEITFLGDSGIFTQTGNGIGHHCFLPDTVASRRYVFPYSVTDPCWRQAIADGSAPSAPPEDSIIIMVQLDRGPEISCLGDLSVDLCEPDSLCYQIGASDPDGDDLQFRILSGPGKIDPTTGQYCLYADAGGTFAVSVAVTDICSKADTCNFTITVNMNGPPAVDIKDTLVSMCGSQEICIPLNVSDPDNNLERIFASDEQGDIIEVVGGSLCFTPPASGTYTITVTAVDSCGAMAMDVASVSVTMDAAPTVTVGDSTFFLCEPAEICLPVTVSGQDTQIDSIIAQEPAYYNENDGTVCLDVSESGEYPLIVTVYDVCGTVTDTGMAVVTINSAPVVTAPPDTSFHLCEPEQICIDPFEFSDVDENIASIEYFPPIGKSTPPPYCFTPDTAGTYCIIGRAIDECGAVDEDTICVEVTFNRPPHVIVPPDTSIFLCEPREICLDGIGADDPDGNLASIEFIPDIGTYDNGRYCFTPDTIGVYCIAVRAVDSCGMFDEDTVCVTYDVGAGVSIDCPPGPVIATLCDGPDTICVDLPVTPADANIEVLEPGAVYHDGRLCTYIENTGVYIYTVVASGDCNADTCKVIFDIKMDETPSITCPTPEPVHLCRPDSISVPMAITPSSALVIATPPAAYKDGVLTFYADEPGEYSYTVVAENDCGADTCTFSMMVTFDSPPQVTFADTTFHLCEIQEVCVPYDYSDPDDNVVSVRITPLKAIYKMVGGKVCFTPPAAGRYDLMMTVTDACGLSAVDTATVEIILNENPSVVVGDTAVFLCQSAEVCLPVTTFDPDGTIESVDVESPAYYDAENHAVCMPIEGAGTYAIGVTVHDDCGATAVDTGRIIATFNHPPEVSVPADTVITQCDQQEICLSGFNVFDLDDNIASVEIFPDAGGYNNGRYCFMPDTAGTYCIVIRATDECGMTDEDTVCVTYDNGVDVAIDCPEGIQQSSLCGPDSICVDIPVTPTDAVITVLEPGAIYSDGRLCFYAASSGQYSFTLVASGDCGADTCQVAFDVTIDERPQITCPPSDTLHLCAPDSITVPLTFGPESAELAVYPPGTYENGQFTFYAAEPGDYCFQATAENSCGADTCDFCITVTFDSPPQVTITDSSLYLCEPAEICIPVEIFDPDNNIQDVTVLPEGATLSDGHICFTPPGAGTYHLIVTATDSCGFMAADTGMIVVTLNQGPSVNVGDTSLFLCEAGEVCLPVDVSDPDGAIDSVVVSPPAYYDADRQMVCLSVSDPGTYEITVTVYDDCGASATDVGSVTVALNSAPAVSLPADSPVFLCEPQEICVPLTYNDIDGNIASIDISPSEYSLVDNMICFTPDAGGLYAIIATVTDSCGLSASDTMKVTVSLNQPPVVTVGDTALFACEPTEVCLPVDMFDPDGEIDSVVVDAPAYYDAANQRVCLPVENPGSYDIVVTVYDDCGIGQSDTGNVTVTFNRPPVVSAPNDTTVFMCTTSEICLDGFAISDPDNNITSIVFDPDIGIYDNGRFCFTPDTAGTYCIRVIATDECGVESEDTVCITVEVGEDIVLTCPDGPQTASLCAPDTICADISVSPPTATIEILEPGAIYDNGRICFYAETAGTYTFTVVASGDCGADTCQVTFDVTSDEAPQITCPSSQSMHLCGPDSISIPVAISPASANVTITPPAAYANGNLTFYADSDGEYCFNIVAENTCGSDTCHVCYTITIDSPPQVTIADTSVYLCDVSEICVPYSYFDPDDNVVNVTVEPIRYTLTDGSVCFTPPGEGTYDIILTVTDSCGNSDADTATVVVTMNQKPNITIGDTTVFLCEPSEVCLPVTFSDPDGTVDSVVAGAPAYYDAENQRVCFPVSVAGTFEIAVTAYDTCDAATTTTGMIIATMNHPPQVTVPADTMMILCDPGQVCLDGFTFADADNNIDLIEVLPETGTYDNGQYCFTADSDGVYCIIARATDECGVVGEDTVCVTIEFGSHAVIDCPPGPIGFTICEPDTLCYPIPVDPVDAKIEVLEADGHYINGELCFYADTTGSYTFTVVATSDCDADTCEVTFNVEANTPPTVSFGPYESPLSLCELQSLCVPIIVGDAEDNIVSVVGSTTCGGASINEARDSLCWTPTEFGSCTLIVIVEDDCGRRDTATAIITLEEGQHPSPPCPANDTVVACLPGEVCIDIGPIQPGSHLTVKPAMYVINPASGTICYIATENRTDTLTITDSTECGKDSCQFVLTTLLNRPPVISGEAPAETKFCHTATICVDYTVSDPDNNIKSVTLAGDCPGAVLDIANSRVCIETTTAIDCHLQLVVVDSCDLADTLILPVVATPNQPPSINLPEIETVVRCESDTSAIVIEDICIHDPDYDDMTLVLDSGLGEFAYNSMYECGVLTFRPPTNDSAQYCFKFLATDYCDTVYSLYCIDVLPSAVCSTCVDVAIEGPPCVNPGSRAIVNITAESFNDVAGYDLLIGYDASALTFLRADVGDAVNGWEYFTYRIGDLGNCEAPCPSGLIKLVAIADINNGAHHPPPEQLHPSGVIATLSFRVTSDLNFGGQRVPVKFFWMDCTDNGFSDPTGQYLYVDHMIFSPEGNIIWNEFDDAAYPEASRPPHIGTPDECMVGDKYTPIRCISYHNGDVCIQHPDSIDARGDMNLNGVTYEIADAVVYTNYFIRGLDAFQISVPGQIAASDVNADGVTLSIADLVYLVRVIVGDAVPYPKPIPESDVVSASCIQRQNEATVTVNSARDIGGVLMTFSGDGVINAVPVLADNAANMDMKYGVLDGNLRVLLFSMKPGGKIPAGAADLITLSVPEGVEVKLVDIEMADYYGRTLTTALTNTNMPDRLYLTQNRPNPFNPSTTFDLALPAASDYNVTIYNITGQVIRKWAGHADAGYITFEWDGRDQQGNMVATGIYFYRARAANQEAICKMVLIK